MELIFWIAGIVAIITVPLILGFKFVYLPYKINLMKHEAKHTKEVEEQKPVQQIESFIQNAPTLYQQVSQEYFNQKAKGVTDQQMSTLKLKMDILGFVANNREIAELGKPFLLEGLKKLKGMI